MCQQRCYRFCLCIIIVFICFYLFTNFVDLFILISYELRFVIEFNTLHSVIFNPTKCNRLDNYVFCSWNQSHWRYTLLTVKRDLWSTYWTASVVQSILGRHSNWCCWYKQQWWITVIFNKMNMLSSYQQHLKNIIDVKFLKCLMHCTCWTVVLIKYYTILFIFLHFFFPNGFLWSMDSLIECIHKIQYDMFVLWWCLCCVRVMSKCKCRHAIDSVVIVIDSRLLFINLCHFICNQLDWLEVLFCLCVCARTTLHVCSFIHSLSYHSSIVFRLIEQLLECCARLKSILSM